MVKDKPMGEWEYRGETADYQVGIRRDGDRWCAQFYHKRGGWGRTTWMQYAEGDVAYQVAHRVAADDMACPLVEGW